MPEPLVPRPTPLPTPLPPGAQGYQLGYAISGPPGACLVQQVTTEVDYLLDDVARISYRGTYAEWFLLDEAAAPHHDVHGFDLLRDRWGVAGMRRLLVRYAIQDAAGRRCDSRGDGRLVVRKTFLLGLGALEGATTGFDFGFLAQGPGGPSGAAIVLSGGPGGLNRRIRAPSASPFGEPAAGRGWFVGTTGWRACETLEHRYATRSTRFDDGQGYLPVSLASPRARGPCSDHAAGL